MQEQDVPTTVPRDPRSPESRERRPEQGVSTTTDPEARAMLKTLTAQLNNLNRSSTVTSTTFEMASPEEMKVPIPDGFEFPDNFQSDLKSEEQPIDNPIGLPDRWLWMSEYGNCGLKKDTLGEISKAIDKLSKDDLSSAPWPSSSGRLIKAVENAFIKILNKLERCNLTGQTKMVAGLILWRRYARLSTTNRDYEIEEAIHWALRMGPKQLEDVKNWYIRRNHSGEIREYRNAYQNLRIRDNQSLQRYMEMIKTWRLRLPLEDRGTVAQMFQKIEDHKTSHKWNTCETTILQSIANRRLEKNNRGEQLDGVDWEVIYREARTNNNQNKLGQQAASPSKAKAEDKGNGNKRKRQQPSPKGNGKGSNTNEQPEKKGRYEGNPTFHCSHHGPNRSHTDKDCKVLRYKQRREANTTVATADTETTTPVTATVGTIDTVGRLQDEIATIKEEAQ